MNNTMEYINRSARKIAGNRIWLLTALVLAVVTGLFIARIPSASAHPVGIDIRKQAEGADTRTVVKGSNVNFKIVVTNTGQQNLSNVNVTDATAPQCNKNIGYLAIGQSKTYTCTVPSVQSSFTNEACAAGYGEETGDQARDCDPSTVKVISIDIRKQAEGPDSRTFPAGSTVPFQIVVTNTGSLSLNNVTVTDAQAPGCARSIGTMAAGASVSYTCNVANVQSGFTNEACVSGERGALRVSDCDPSTVVVQRPAIDIRKQVEGPDTRSFPAGSTVPFEIVVTNTGSTILNNVAVTDAQAPGCARSIGTLAAGASFTYTCTVPNVQSTFTNEACVSGTANGTTVTDCDPSTVVVLRPAIDIRKQAEGPDTRTVPKGSSVSFQIVVTNTGGTILSNVAVTDAQAPGCARSIGTLAVGASSTYTCTVTNVQSTFTNEACVSGTGNGTTVTDCDPSTVEAIAIDIRKQAEGPDTRTVRTGSDVTFAIVVTNTGSETLSNVVVTDVQAPGCGRTIGTLAAGASVSYSCTAPNVTADFTNEACVTGDRNGATVTDCDPSTVVVQQICLVLIDEEGVDNDMRSIEQAAASHGVRPDFLVNDDSPTQSGNPPFRWNQLFPGDVVKLPTGQVDDEGWFALPEFTPWSLSSFVAGTVPQSALDKIPNVMPLRNQDLVKLVGRTCTAVVYDSDISMNYLPINANLQGDRYGLFSFTVLAVEVPGSLPESGSSSSLYDLWLRIEPPLTPTERFLVPVRDHEPDSISLTIYEYNNGRLTVHGESNFAPGARMTVTVDGADAAGSPTVPPFILEAPMTYRTGKRYEFTLSTPVNLKGRRVTIQTDAGGSSTDYIK